MPPAPRSKLPVTIRLAACLLSIAGTSLVATCRLQDLVNPGKIHALQLAPAALVDSARAGALSPAIAKPDLRSSNVSPEVTLTYTPTDNLTVFGAFKQGYKSGSFILTSPPAAGKDISFGDEKVEQHVPGRFPEQRTILEHALAKTPGLVLPQGDVQRRGMLLSRRDEQ